MDDRYENLNQNEYTPETIPASGGFEEAYREMRQAEPAPWADSTAPAEPAPQTEAQTAPDYFSAQPQGSFYQPPQPEQQAEPDPGHYQMPDYPTYQDYGPVYRAPKKPKAPKTPKVPKDKKKIGFGGLVASLVLVSMLTSGATGAAVYTLMQDNGDTASTSDTGSTSGNKTTVETINVTTSSDNLIAAVNKKAGPSVVGIRTSVKVSNGFFGDSTGTEEGSGVIYSEDGYIITNYHVISSAVTSTGSSIDVYLPDDVDTAIPATLVGYDANTDLAVLKIEKTGLTAISFSSGILEVGETVIAIGNPGGLEFMGSVSAGIVSGLDRKITLPDIGEMSLIQTDATINPGNSGGALVNIKGELVGINNSKMVQTGFEGMGFSIPAATVKETVEMIISNKDKKAPYIGIEISTRYDEETLTKMGYPAGIVVSSVAEDSPAEAAGIERGDLITKFNGVEVKSLATLNSAKNKCDIGDTVTVTVYRGKKTIELKLTLG